MKTFLIGLLAGAILLGAGWRLVVLHDWKVNVDQRGFVTERTGTYLFGPSGVVNAKGESLSRQQLLDAYLEAQIKAHPEWGLSFKDK